MSPITNPDMYLQREDEDPAVTALGVLPGVSAARQRRAALGAR